MDETHECGQCFLASQRNATTGMEAFLRGEVGPPGASGVNTGLLLEPFLGRVAKQGHGGVLLRPLGKGPGVNARFGGGCHPGVGERFFHPRVVTRDLEKFFMETPNWKFQPDGGGEKGG
ncbi:hypothetical protein CJP68_04405 [Brucella melitensis]|nr:hypothetical protein CJP68_04405 [Brucella melitensis]